MSATTTVSQALNEACREATIENLKAQNEGLLRQNSRLAALVKNIPSLIVQARLDAKEGKATKVNYKAIQKALTSFD